MGFKKSHRVALVALAIAVISCRRGTQPELEVAKPWLYIRGRVALDFWLAPFSCWLPVPGQWCGFHTHAWRPAIAYGGSEKPVSGLPLRLADNQVALATQENHMGSAASICASGAQGPRFSSIPLVDNPVALAT